MTTTVLAVIALAGPLGVGAKPEFQIQTDYGHALKQAANEQKPMAVLIGKGDVFGKILTDTVITTNTKKLLSEKYVCVSVNLDTEAGKALAKQFDMSTGGLVISSAGGTHQALRQPGAITASELAKHLDSYATPTGIPTTTVTVGVASSSPPPVYSSSPPSYVYPAGGYSFPQTSPFGARPVQNCTGFR